MKNFVNDEMVVGKWKKIAVVKNKEDFEKKLFDDMSIFTADEIYFLPGGEEYWVFGWTKGTLFVKDRHFPYKIINGKMFVGIVDFQSGKIDNYAVFEQVDRKKYQKEEIEIKDNINIPFINDKNVVGFWNSVDFVEKISDFKPGEKQFSDELYLKKYAFEPNGILTAFYGDKNFTYSLKWSKNVVIDENGQTASDYLIKNIDGDDYMFVEWKSGDYRFGGKVFGNYVLKKAR